MTGMVHKSLWLSLGQSFEHVTLYTYNGTAIFFGAIPEYYRNKSDFNYGMSALPIGFLERINLRNLLGIENVNILYLLHCTQIPMYVSIAAITGPWNCVAYRDIHLV